MDHRNIVRRFFRQLRKLLEIEEKLILLTEDDNMDQALTDLIAAFDAATDRIAARIAKLIAAGSGLSPEAKAALQAEVDKLNLLGQDPANPLPPGV